MATAELAPATATGYAAPHMLTGDVADVVLPSTSGSPLSIVAIVLRNDIVCVTSGPPGRGGSRSPSPIPVEFALTGS